MTRERLIPLREKEQQACANVLGVRTCTFLGGEDGELDYSRDMLGKIVREIRRLKPYAIFTHTPDLIHRRATPGRIEGALAEYEGFINHRDHRNTGSMSIDAVYPTARDHLNFPEHLSEEGLDTHHVREIYVWGDNDPNFAVDITDVLDTKIEALLKHHSQFGHRGEIFAEHIRSRWGDADGRYYERFDRIILPL